MCTIINRRILIKASNDLYNTTTSTNNTISIFAYYLSFWKMTFFNNADWIGYLAENTIQKCISLTLVKYLLVHRETRHLVRSWTPEVNTISTIQYHSSSNILINIKSNAARVWNKPQIQKPTKDIKSIIS